MRLNRLKLAVWLGIGLIAARTHGGEIRTNEIIATDAPTWVTASRIDRIVDHIQNLLEWDIRRIHAYFYADQAVFERLHGFGPSVLAFSRQSDGTVHVGPKVGNSDFDAVFGHELVHVILYQKYHGSIPKYLEEGLANYLNQRGGIDYPWIASRLGDQDVHQWVHPFKGFVLGDAASTDRARFHYLASQALVTMIASKCDLSDLLQMSVGKDLEKYLDTLCGIPDVNAGFRKWVKSKLSPSSP